MKTATIRAGDAIEIGDDRRIVIIRQDGGKIMVQIDAPEHVRIVPRFATREADAERECGRDKRPLAGRRARTPISAE